MKKKLSYILFVFIVTNLLFSSCKQHQINNQVPDALSVHVDSSINPGNDFFLYANGKWFKQHPIPASEQSNGLWQLIQDTLDAQIRKICESSAATKSVKKGSNKQKIGDFFASGTDSVTINNSGVSGLKDDFEMIDKIKDLKGIIKAAAYVHAVSGSPMFSFYVGQDDKLSNKITLFFGQGGLSLPNRNYYFDTDNRSKNIRKKFVSYLQNMYQIIGYNESKSKKVADNIMKLETAIAKVSRKQEDTRDPWKNYNKMTFEQLGKSTPNIDWTLFTKEIGLQKVDTVVVGQPEFFKALNGYLKSYSLDDWKNYLKFHLINGLTRYLDDKTYMAHFGFYNTTLLGVPEPKPRWNRVVQETDALLGELIGQVYVAEYLPKGTKEKMIEIANAVKSIFAERIKKLDWMSDVTKEKAVTKLNAVIMKIGYPDKWKDLSALQIDRSSYLKNAINANKWSFNYAINKYGKPVDRTEWGMQPQTYNAYYSPSNNEIVIPGCNIIVPGFERKLADDAILYAIVGATFGHEITHGFDDQGCKYDALGNLRNWWTKDDSAKFYARTKMIIEQFNEYIAVDSLHINGTLTQGENIADLGGIVMGYEAFKKTKQFTGNEKIAGLSPAQRFFLGFALGWMINERPEATANQVKSNVHSPAKFRVIGSLSNMPEFFEAFGIKKGDAMWRANDKIVKIW